MPLAQIEEIVDAGGLLLVPCLASQALKRLMHKLANNLLIALLVWIIIVARFTHNVSACTL